MRVFFWKRFYYLILFVSLTFFSCSSDDASPTDTPFDFDGRGKIDFSVSYDYGVNILKKPFRWLIADLYDENGRLVTTQQFNAAAYGEIYTMEDVPGGADRTLVLYGKVSSGDIVRRGERHGVAVSKDRTTSVSSVYLEKFAVQLVAPENQTWVNNFETVRLKWEALPGDVTYRIAVTGIVEDYISEVSYSLSGFSYEEPLSDDLGILLSETNVRFWPFPSSHVDRHNYDYERFGVYGESIFGIKFIFWDVTPIDSYGKEGRSQQNRFDLGSAVIFDHVTGLVWESKSDDGTINDRDDTYSWSEAQNEFIAGLNNMEYAGLGGDEDESKIWRLPTVKELSALLHCFPYSSAPYISALFANTQGKKDNDQFNDYDSGYYWTATSSAMDDHDAWCVDFATGEVFPVAKESSVGEMLFVRAVRGPKAGDITLIDNGDGTVSDYYAGLMWQRVPVSVTKTWAEVDGVPGAKEYCETLVLNNDGEWTNEEDGEHNGTGIKYDDWRLPNRNELQSIVDYTNSKPAAYTEFFEQIESEGKYWTSSEVPFIRVGQVFTHRWVVDFGDGSIKYESISDQNKCYVIAVRDHIP